MAQFRATAGPQLVLLRIRPDTMKRSPLRSSSHKSLQNDWAYPPWVHASPQLRLVFLNSCMWGLARSLTYASDPERAWWSLVGIANAAAKHFGQPLKSAPCCVKKQKDRRPVINPGAPVRVLVFSRNHLQVQWIQYRIRMCVLHRNQSTGSGNFQAVLHQPGMMWLDLTAGLPSQAAEIAGYISFKPCQASFDAVSSLCCSRMGKKVLGSWPAGGPRH